MWKNKIATIGIKAVSENLNISYETVRAWVNDGLSPGKANAQKLLEYFKQILTAVEYEAFRESLLKEMIPV